MMVIHGAVCAVNSYGDTCQEHHGWECGFTFRRVWMVVKRVVSHYLLTKGFFFVCFLLGDSSASEFYMPTFRNILSCLRRWVWRWNRVFLNVGISNSDAGELPRRKHTTFRTRQKFEIKKGVFFFPSCFQLNLQVDRLILKAFVEECLSF